MRPDERVRRRALTRQFKEVERAEARRKLGLEADALYSLHEHLEFRLQDTPCNHVTPDKFGWPC